jgi:S1-C subfamily serine protease
VQSLGSGTLIDVRDRYGLVITNWHVIRDAKGDVLVTFPNGFQSKAQILQVDQDWDLAALVIWRPELMPVPLTTVAPQPGDRLIIAGYGSGKYRAVRIALATPAARDD